MKIATKIFMIGSLLSLLMAAGCNLSENTVQPTLKKNPETETKWLCDNGSGEKVSVESIKTYDRNGNLLNWDEFNANGDYISKSTYQYIGMTTNINKQFYNNSGGVDSVRISRLSTNSAGLVVEKVLMDNNGNTLTIQTYEYDNSGNVINKTTKNETGAVESQVTYQYSYNNAGDMVSRLQNPTLDGSFQAKDSLIYYSGDKKVDRISYNSQGDLEIKYTYIYNAYGLIIEEIQSNEKGIVNRYKFDYTYY